MKLLVAFEGSVSIAGDLEKAEKILDGLPSVDIVLCDININGGFNWGKEQTQQDRKVIMLINQNPSSFADICKNRAWNKRTDMSLLIEEIRKCLAS